MILQCKGFSRCDCIQCKEKFHQHCNSFRHQFSIPTVNINDENDSFKEESFEEDLLDLDDSLFEIEFFEEK